MHDTVVPQAAMSTRNDFIDKASMHRVHGRQMELFQRDEFTHMQNRFSELVFNEAFALSNLCFY